MGEAGDAHGLDTACSATIAPVWAALLSGSAESYGRGSFSDEVGDATGRVPNLWFGDADEDGNRGALCVDVSAAKKD